jgi:hypothetical protein
MAHYSRGIDEKEEGCGDDRRNLARSTSNRKMGWTEHGFEKPLEKLEAIRLCPGSHHTMVAHTTRQLRRSLASARILDMQETTTIIFATQN